MRERLGKRDEALYPHLTPKNYKVTSKKDTKYNCVAWAAERDEKRWWEPLKEPGCYWPDGVPFDHAFENYVKVFELLGYVKCDNHSLEHGFEKVVLYRDLYGWFSHVAHQLEDGKWTSKLGPEEDLRHEDIHALEGRNQLEAYGKGEVFLKRARRIWENPPRVC